MNHQWYTKGSVVTAPAETHELRTRPRSHALRDTPERELPIKDALLVLAGAMLIMLGIALLTGWLIDASNEHLRQQTAAIATTPAAAAQEAVAALKPQSPASDLTSLQTPVPHDSVAESYPASER
tara:strand:+ start:705 stop:1079 length:375 start_codon:yes stop_codon:yes gene_type:complete